MVVVSELYNQKKKTEIFRILTHKPCTHIAGGAAFCTECRKNWLHKNIENGDEERVWVLFLLFCARRQISCIFRGNFTRVYQRKCLFKWNFTVNEWEKLPVLNGDFKLMTNNKETENNQMNCLMNRFLIVGTLLEIVFFFLFKIKKIEPSEMVVNLSWNDVSLEFLWCWCCRKIIDVGYI